MTRAVESTSVLSTRRGKLVLALLCSIGFLDFMDAVIVNVALPSMQHQLGSPSRACSGWPPATC